MRVPKKSTATYKKAYFFHPILPAHPIFPAFPALSLVPPVPPVPPVSLVSLVSLVPPVSPVSLVPLVPPVPALLALSEKISFIASLYFRYRKDTGSPKDYRKMSEVQTSNHRLKTRKILFIIYFKSLIPPSLLSLPIPPINQKNILLLLKKLTTKA